MTARTRDREIFPHVEDRIGEDPAVFLDRELLVAEPSLRRLKTDADGRPRYVPDVSQGDPIEFVAARIRGIDRLDVIGAWKGVEERLLRTPERGRDEVNELLQERARELESDGTRDDQLQRRREVDPSRRTPPVFVDLEGDEYTLEEWRGGTVDEKIAALDDGDQDDVDGDLDEEDETTIAWRHVACGGTDVEEQKAGVAWFCRDCEQRVPKNRVEAVEAGEVVA